VWYARGATGTPGGSSTEEVSYRPVSYPPVTSSPSSNTRSNGSPSGFAGGVRTGVRQGGRGARASSTLGNLFFEKPAKIFWGERIRRANRNETSTHNATCQHLTPPSDTPPGRMPVVAVRTQRTAVLRIVRVIPVKDKLAPGARVMVRNRRLVAAHHTHIHGTPKDTGPKPVTMLDVVAALHRSATRPVRLPVMLTAKPAPKHRLAAPTARPQRASRHP
jgi:hypothetical protein